MARILLVGSRADATRYVAARLRSEGWEVVQAVGPEEGLGAIEREPEVDALIVGGPVAWAARDLNGAGMADDDGAVASPVTGTLASWKVEDGAEVAETHDADRSLARLARVDVLPAPLALPDPLHRTPARARSTRRTGHRGPFAARHARPARIP